MVEKKEGGGGKKDGDTVSAGEDVGYSGIQAFTFRQKAKFPFPVPRGELNMLIQVYCLLPPPPTPSPFLRATDYRVMSY